MKKFLLSSLCLIFCLSLYAQSDEEYTRKGKVLIETGYNLIGGLQGGTGASILFDESNTITSLGLNGGYFISNDFALKFGLGIISAGSSITSFSVGGKYYVKGSIPIELGIGTISGDGYSEFIGKLNIGYGIKLAQNINLEPSIGLLIAESSVGNFAVNFVMFL